MSKLRFEFEWQDPAGAKGEELRATWASLSILIDGSPITELHDRLSKSVRTSVFLPLFPLAEWIASNWWFLRSETDRPNNFSNRSFDQRHNLRWAREGFVLPSLRFVTLGDYVEAVWQPFDIPDAGIKFPGIGQAVLDWNDVTETLRDFLNAVVSRLDECNVSRTSLHDEWDAIQNADSDEQEFCHAAARLGVDPYAIDHLAEAGILEAAARIRIELLSDFLSLTTLDQLANQASLLESAVRSIASDTDDIDALRIVRSHVPPINANNNPWETGYHFAALLRANLNGGDWRSQSLDDLAGHLSIDQFDHCLLTETTNCGFMDALTGSNQRNNPKFVIEKQRPDSQQFAFCRALFEHLTTSPNRFAIVSRLKSHRQQMNRAFAAEFLAPHKMLKKDLSSEVVGEDEIDDLASEYGVSGFVISHQIQNHKLARISPE